MVITVVAWKVEAFGHHRCGEEGLAKVSRLMLWCVRVDLDRSKPFLCASEANALVLGCIVGVCNKNIYMHWLMQGLRYY
jgi:hypothetical protein